MFGELQPFTVSRNLWYKKKVTVSGVGRVGTDPTLNPQKYFDPTLNNNRSYLEYITVCIQDRLYLG